MKYKIICDSSCDLNSDFIKDPLVGFEIIPLFIHVDKKEFLDDNDLNVLDMLKAMHEYKGKSTTSCPAPMKFLESYDAEYNFCVTITKKLSGTYNSAHLASTMIEENKKVFLIDSKGTSGSLALITLKLYELIKKGLEYETICEEIIKYRDSINLFFVLDSFDNLVKNGRMSKLAAKIATLMVIRPICIAEDGEIKVYKKVRTRNTAIKSMINEIINTNVDFENRECIITHALDIECATNIKRMLEEKIKFKKITILPMKGLCSFYALEKGIIVTF